MYFSHLTEKLSGRADIVYLDPKPILFYSIEEYILFPLNASVGSLSLSFKVLIKLASRTELAQ